MSSLVARTNDALKIDPPTGSEFHICVNGSDCLWAVTAVYSFSLLVVVGLAHFSVNSFGDVDIGKAYVCHLMSSFYDTPLGLWRRAVVYLKMIIVWSPMSL
jgi:bacteriorhodopsin